MPDAVEVPKKVAKKPSAEALKKLAGVVTKPAKTGLDALKAVVKKPVGMAKAGLDKLKGALPKKPAKKEA